jgi:hypothetical protein
VITFRDDALLWMHPQMTETHRDHGWCRGRQAESPEDDRLTARTGQQIPGFFDALELVEPGLVSMSRWRYDDTQFGEPMETAGFCGVDRKP